MKREESSGEWKMVRTIVVAALTVGLLALVTTDAGAQKKNTEVADFATDQDYKWLATIKDMTGKLASINTSSVTFRLDIPHMVPNPKYRPPKGSNNQHNHLLNIYRQQAQVMATTNPFVRQIRMQQLLATIQVQQYQQMMQVAAANSNPNNQPFKLAHEYKDFELELSEKVSIRKMFLETEYDDKGNVKVYSKEEKAELHGKDTAKPGYLAKMEDLQAGLYAKVYLKMPKKTKPPSETVKSDAKADDPGKAADKDKDGDKAKVVDKADQAADKGKNKDDKAAKDEVIRPLITMIVILQPLDLPMSTDTVPAKKKKDN